MQEKTSQISLFAKPSFVGRNHANTNALKIRTNSRRKTQLRALLIQFLKTYLKIMSWSLNSISSQILDLFSLLYLSTEPTGKEV